MSIMTISTKVKKNNIIDETRLLHNKSDVINTKELLKQSSATFDKNSINLNLDLDELRNNSPFQQSFICNQTVPSQYNIKTVNSVNNIMDSNINSGKISSETIRINDLEYFQKQTKTQQICKTSGNFFELFQETGNYIKNSMKSSELNQQIIDERIKALEACFQRSGIKGAKMLHDLEGEIVVFFCEN